MNLAVRQVSLTDDRAEMLELLHRNLPDPHEVGFDWRYIHNPAGRGLSWFLHERGSRDAVAMASVFPRKMYADGKELLAGQVMHFVVDAEYRSLGPAVLLQRTTFAPVDSGELDFCYDCPPHDQGMSTFVRLGMRPNCELTRYALMFRSDEYFEKKIGNKFVRKPVAVLTNVLLSRRRSHSRPNGFEICIYGDRFDEEFSALDRLVSSAGIVRQRRSAEELNYRYRENPERQHRVLAARRSGELLGFAIFETSDGIASLVDVFGREMTTIATPLLDAVVEVCRRENMSALHGNCSTGSELEGIFLANGFRRREMAARVVAYAKSDSGMHKLLSKNIRWAFSRVEWLG